MRDVVTLVFVVWGTMLLLGCTQNNDLQKTENIAVEKERVALEETRAAVEKERQELRQQQANLQRQAEHEAQRQAQIDAQNQARIEAERRAEEEFRSKKIDEVSTLVSAGAVETERKALDIFNMLQGSAGRRELPPGLQNDLFQEMRARLMSDTRGITDKQVFLGALQRSAETWLHDYELRLRKKYL